MNDKYAVKTLSFGHFTIDAYSGFLNPIMPFIAAKIGITMTIATMIISLSNIVASCSQPFFGFIADKWRRRFFIFWGMLLASSFLSSVGLADSLWKLACCIIFGNIGVAFYHPQATSFVPVFSTPDKLSKDISIFIALGTAGFALGPAISSSISAKWGVGSLIFASVFGIIYSFFLLFTVPKVPSITEHKEKSSLFIALKEVFSDRTMLILILASTVKSFISSTFLILLPFYWKNLGWAVSKIGIILFLFMLFGAIGILASPYLEKNIGIRKTFYLSFLTIFPLTLAFYFLQNINEFASLAALVLIQFFCFLAVPLNMSMAQKLMPQHKSMTAGFIGGFSWGVIGIMLPAFSLLAEHIGIMNVIIATTVIPLLFCLCIKYLPEKV